MPLVFFLALGGTLAQPDKVRPLDFWLNRIAVGDANHSLSCIVQVRVTYDDTIKRYICQQEIFRLVPLLGDSLKMTADGQIAAPSTPGSGLAMTQNFLI